MDIVNGYKSWRKYRSTYNELARMTHRELSDIGIDRADIEKLARQTAGF